MWAVLHFTKGHDIMKLASHEVNFIMCIGGIMLNQVKKFRVANKYTQEQLAEIVGVSSRTIISLEKGKYKPSIMLAYRLATLFELSIEDLFMLEKNAELEEK